MKGTTSTITATIRKRHASGPKTLRFTAVLALGLTVCGFIFLGFVLVSRFYYQSGIHLADQGNIHQAIARFKTAKTIIDHPLVSWLPIPDSHRIHRDLGRTLARQGMASDSVYRSFILLDKGKKLLEKAVRDCPEDYLSALWLARTVDSLETVWQRIHSSDGRINPCKALGLYEKALALRPNGVMVNHLFLNCLYRQQKRDRLAERAGFIARIHPDSYFQLKQEPFFSKSVAQAVRAGLTEALKDTATSRRAYLALSEALADQGDVQGAIRLYDEAVERYPELRTWRNLLNTGKLGLSGSDPKKSFAYFLKALSLARGKIGCLEELFEAFKQGNAWDLFLKLAPEISTVIPRPLQLDLMIAECLMELDRDKEAMEKLTAVLRMASSDRAWYLMAILEESRGNWDAMETAARKATVLNQGNPAYYTLLARALKQQGRYYPAEQAATRALELSAYPTVGIYNLRAWIRWYRDDFSGAISDWLNVSAIAPADPDIVRNMANAYWKLGDKKKAHELSRKAQAMNQWPSPQKNGLP